MSRSYLRLDPDFAERKRGYPDGPYRALVDVFCAAEYEPKRGQFRSIAILRAVIGRSARHLPYLFAKKDIALTDDDRIQVVGWDEWQEGNLLVGERMRQVGQERARRRGEPVLVSEPTPGAVRTARWRERHQRHGDVSPLASSDDVTSSERLAVGGKPLAVSGEQRDARTESDPYDEAVRWLASRKAWMGSPKIETELARLVDRKGLAAVIAAMAAVPGAEDAAQFVYGARNALFPLAGSQTTKPPTPAERDTAEAKQRIAAARAAREGAQA